MTKENNSDKQALDQLAEGIRQIDEQRLSELKNLKQLQEIKDEVLKREAIRLSEKHGTNHPRVLKANARQEYNQKLFQGLELEINRGSIKQDQLPNNAWRIHGKVFGQNMETLHGVTVFFSDEKKNWIKELGNACTDERGNYSITLDENLIDFMQKQPLYLCVCDKNQKIIWQDREIAFASKGLIEYKDIYITNGDDCIPPMATDRGKDNSLM